MCDRSGQPVVTSWGETRESQPSFFHEKTQHDGTAQSIVNEFHHKQFVESSYSACYSGWDDDKAWSSQEWKADELMDDRTVTPVVASWARTHEFQSSFSHEKTKHVILEEEENHDRSAQPVVNPQREARPQQFIIGNDETELELSVESRSFLNRVNVQVWKRQKRSSMNVTEDGEKHSMIWGMFMAAAIESAVFMGKNCQNNCHSIVNTTDLTLKQMFDTSTRLVSEQDEISGLETIGWENHSWKYLSLVGNKDLSIFSAQRSTSFQILYCVLVRYTRTPNRTMHGKKDWDGSKHLRNTETLTESTASQWNSSGIFSQDSIRCSSAKKSKVYCTDWRNTRKFHRKNYLHVDVQRYLLWIKRQ